jgi:hypothetical protein
VPTARERLFGGNAKCDAGDRCIFGGNIQQGEDVWVVWIHRGPYPFLLADIVSLDGEFELYHSDCMNRGEEAKTDAREAGTDTGTVKT